MNYIAQAVTLICVIGWQQTCYISEAFYAICMLYSTASARLFGMALMVHIIEKGCHCSTEAMFWSILIVLLYFVFIGLTVG